MVRSPHRRAFQVRSVFKFTDILLVFLPLPLPLPLHLPLPLSNPIFSFQFEKPFSQKLARRAHPDKRPAAGGGGGGGGGSGGGGNDDNDAFIESRRAHDILSVRHKREE